jgi:predicted GNAT family N-acyltransferase
MLEGKYLLFGDCYDDVIYVRKQCVSRKNVEDEMDNEAIHVIVYENKEPIACGRMLIQENKSIFDNIYVIEGKRRNKIGDFTLRLLIEKVNVMCIKEIVLWCQKENREFFKSVGFIEMKEISDNHINMIKMGLDVESFFNNKNCCK